MILDELEQELEKFTKSMDNLRILFAELKYKSGLDDKRVGDLFYEIDNLPDDILGYILNEKGIGQ